MANHCNTSSWPVTMQLKVVSPKRWLSVADTLLLLSPKGVGVPYVGFSDFGQADVNAFYF